MPQTERVRALLEPAIAAQGLVLESVTVTPAGRRRVVRVVVDLPGDAEGGLDLDRVAAASRAVSDALDADDAAPRPALGGQPYVLEVTTPGVDRPLTEPRHWQRARGRLVTVRVGAAGGDQRQVTGRVTAVDEGGVELGEGGPGRVGWADLGPGAVQVELNRAPAVEPGRDDAQPSEDTED